MGRWITIVVLAIALVGTGVWGYKENQEKNAVLIQAENTYQRSFHDLSYHMDLLHDQIGTTLAMNSTERLSPQFVEIWRLTSESLADVGQLPLGLLPFNKTEEFLSNIGDFTYKTAIRDLENSPLTEEETASLKDLYGQAGEIRNELRQIQHLALDNNLRWMDVELALATQDEQMDNTIIDGFRTVEKSVEGYTESNADSAILTNSTKEHTFKSLTGNHISEKEAIQKGMDIFKAENEKYITVAESGDGADVPMYSVSYNNGDKKAYMDITKQGGHPLTLLVSRTVGGKQISLNEGSEIAQDYLRELEMQDMMLYQSNEYNNVGVYSFLHTQDGVRVYSDAVEVKVALDNGDVAGLTTTNYFMNHTERDIPKPVLSEEEAMRLVNANVDIQEQFLAVIDNDSGDEVLAYEFLGVLNDDTYRIFINAMDGKEEKVEKLDGTEINYASIHQG